MSQPVQLQRTVLSFKNKESGEEKVECGSWKYVLAQPLLTARDDNLVWVTAEKYDHSRALYSGFQLLVCPLSAIDNAPIQKPVPLPPETHKSRTSGSFTTATTILPSCILLFLLSTCSPSSSFLLSYMLSELRNFSSTIFN